MKFYIFILSILTTVLSRPIECKEAAYVTVADESRYTQIAVIDLDNPQMVKYIPIGPDAEGGNLIRTPDGKSLLLAGVRSNKIYQIDLETDTVIDSMSISLPSEIAITPDGKYILCADSPQISDKLSFIDWSEKKVIHEIEGENRFATEIVITPDGRLAYLRGLDHIAVVDIAQKQIIDTIVLKGGLTGSPSHTVLAWNNRKELLYVAEDQKGWISKVDSTSHQIVGTIKLNTEAVPSHIAFDACEERLYVSTHIAHDIVDVESEKIIRRMPSTPSPPFPSRLPPGRDLAFTPNGKSVYLTTSASYHIEGETPPIPGRVWIMSTTQNVILYKLEIALETYALAMVEYPPPLLGDFNSDRQVTFEDFILFASAFGTNIQDEHWDYKYDLKRDNKVDFTDFVQFVHLFTQE